MPFTAEEQNEARRLFSDELHDAGLPCPLSKPEGRQLMSRLGLWLDNQQANVRTALDAQAPAISAKLTDAHLKQIIKKAVKIW